MSEWIYLDMSFDMTCIMQRISLLNLKLFGPMNTELCAQEIVEFCIVWEIGLVGILLPTNMTAGLRFSKLQTAVTLAVVDISN